MAFWKKFFGGAADENKSGQSAEEGRTYKLAAAAKKGDVDAVKAALAEGARPNVYVYDWTDYKRAFGLKDPVNIAVAAGQVEAAKVLVAAGGYLEWNEIERYVYHDEEQAMQALLEAYSGKKHVRSFVLNKASEYGCKNSVVLALAAGATEEERNEALNLLISSKDLLTSTVLEIAPLLLKAGVSIESKKDALQLATKKGDAEVVQLLFSSIEQDVVGQPDAADQMQTAFYRAVKGKTEESLALPVVAFFEKKGYLPTQSFKARHSGAQPS